ncbi:unnamed protein product [Oncorhynchus mykiss]|uniref:Uncharacterized protein n=1 Tax=Oncorhynchus mykiss TaxID=8022 RepID=A0A060YNI6_ONCMY|nr:unnamed protein product [Oncorhynchus mykiss]
MCRVQCKSIQIPLLYPHFVNCLLLVGFFCCDVACKYWPYLHNIVQACAVLEGLQKMHSLLSVMHVKAH